MKNGVEFKWTTGPTAHQEVIFSNFSTERPANRVRQVGNFAIFVVFATGLTLIGKGMDSYVEHDQLDITYKQIANIYKLFVSGGLLYGGITAVRNIYDARAR